MPAARRPHISLSLYLAFAAACGGTSAAPDSMLAEDAVVPDALAADAAVPEVTFDQFGAAGGAHAREVSVDAAGNAFVMGMTSGPIDLGGGELPARTDQPQVWIASYTADGAHRWSHVLASTTARATGYESQLGGICGDGAGGAWIAAVPLGPISLGGTAVALGATTRGVVIAHLDAAGAVTFIETSTTTAASIHASARVAQAAQGGVYAALTLLGTSVVGGRSTTEPGWHFARLGSDGQAAWLQRLTGDAPQVARLASNSSGALVAIGTFRQYLTLGALTLTKLNTRDSPFLLRIPAALEAAATGVEIPVCSTCSSDALADLGMDVALAPDGSAFALWNVAAGAYGWSAARFLPDGSQAWTVQPSAGWELNGIAVRGDTVSVVGRTRGLVAVGAHQPDGDAGMVRVELAAQTGAIEAWSTATSPSVHDQWSDVAATATGWITVAGVEGPLQLGGQTLAATGGRDAVIARFAR